MQSVSAIGAKTKHVRRGVKEVVKALRKDEKGIVIIAGDISPIDVIAHVPILCEEKGLPYVYVPAKIVSQPSCWSQCCS